MSKYEAIYLFVFLGKYLFAPMFIVCLVAEAIERYVNRNIDVLDWTARLESGEELVGGESGNLFSLDRN